EILLSKTKSLLSIDSIELLENALQYSIQHGELINENDNVYLPTLYLFEEELAQIIAQRIKNFPNNKNQISDDIIERSSKITINNQNENHNDPLIILSPEQKQALEYSARMNLVVITGG